MDKQKELKKIMEMKKRELERQRQENERRRDPSEDDPDKNRYLSNYNLYSLTNKYIKIIYFYIEKYLLAHYQQ